MAVSLKGRERIIAALDVPGPAAAAAPGSVASRSGRPSTTYDAPASIAERGVPTRR